MQDVPSLQLYFPGVQLVQALPKPAGASIPAGQAVHCVDPVAWWWSFGQYKGGSQDCKMSSFAFSQSQAVLVVFGLFESGLSGGSMFNISSIWSDPSVTLRRKAFSRGAFFTSAGETTLKSVSALQPEAMIDEGEQQSSLLAVLH